jgi:aminoglycoside phosphotransferase
LLQHDRSEAETIRAGHLNIATRFLVENWQELELGLDTSPERVSWVVLTPNFPASGHVIFLVLHEDVSGPVLVMKVARLPGGNSSLRREAANLDTVHGARKDGFSSIPRMITFKSMGANSILAETALVGVAMDPAFVRKKTEWSIETVLDWLIDLHRSTTVMNTDSRDWFSRLVEEPVARLESVLSPSGEEEGLIRTVRSMAEDLRGVDFPLVFSHGDLSNPNIIALDQGGIGVVDWETAEAHSLPAADLFFFLNFVAFARRPPRSADDFTAFQEAFCSASSWSAPYISRYAEAMRLPGELLKPLFVLCFTRYLSEFTARLCGSRNVLDRETSTWLRSDRVYVLWREAVQSAGNLTLA